MMKNKKTIFEENQYDAIYPDGIENHYWQKARANIIFNILKRHGMLGLKYLEIGCGRGVMVQSFKEKGLDIKGVELAEINPIISIANDISAGISFDEISEKIRLLYTGILLLDVIEHIERPSEFIESIFDSFPNATKILFTVPAKQDIWSNYDDCYGHYKRYELIDILDLSKKTNSNIIDQGYFFHSLYFLAKVLLKYQNNRSIKVKAPRGFLKAIHSCLALGFYVEYKVVSTCVSGSSLFFILSRKT